MHKLHQGFTITLGASGVISSSTVAATAPHGVVSHGANVEIRSSNIRAGTYYAVLARESGKVLILNSSLQANSNNTLVVNNGFIIAQNCTITGNCVAQKSNGNELITTVSIGSKSATITAWGVPSTATSSQFPTWSVKDGQDDLKWHNATKQSSGAWKATINLSEHGNYSGRYITHIYYFYNSNNYITKLDYVDYVI